MPPKKPGSSTSYQRLQEREKNKEKAQKKEFERLEQVAKDELKAKDDAFSANMSVLSTSVRLNMAAADYVNSRTRPGMFVPDICRLYDVKESSFYNTVSKLKAQRTALDSDAKIRAAAATTSSSAAPLGGGAALPTRSVHFPDDILHFDPALELDDAAQSMLWQENLRKRRELQKKVEDAVKAATEHASSLEGKRTEAQKRKQFDATKKDLEAAAKKAKKDVQNFDSQLLSTQLGIDSLGPAIAGRPLEFTEETIDAVIAHFNKIQTTIKNGVSQAALVQMLLRYRQKLQSPSAES